jgi:hypothetical protein
MMRIYSIYLISFFIFLLTGCTFLSQKIESLENKDNLQSNFNSSLTTKNKTLYCFENSYEQYYLEDDVTQNFYVQNFINANSKLNFIQKSILLSLYEMLRRPDISGPFSRLQVYLRLDRDYYFDFRPSDLSDMNSMPYLYGLEKIHNTFEKKENFKTFLKKYNSSFKINLPVSTEFELFLKSHKNDILKDENLINVFTKGDETLTKHESFQAGKLTKIINEYYGKYLNKEDLYYYDKNRITASVKNDKLSCNFDLSIEINKDDIFTYDKKDTHPFALKEGKNIFIAIASTLNDKSTKTLPETYFFKNKPSPTPVPLCKFVSEKMNLITFSTLNRDPSQHLKHLFQYEIFNADSFPSLVEYLNFPRHLFLSSPERILYESKRGRKSQLDYLLSMNFPIYHIDTLGNIFGFASFFNNKKEAQFDSMFIDERNNNKLWCGKTK